MGGWERALESDQAKRAYGARATPCRPLAVRLASLATDEEAQPEHGHHDEEDQRGDQHVHGVPRRNVGADMCRPPCHCADWFGAGTIWSKGSRDGRQTRTPSWLRAAFGSLPTNAQGQAGALRGRRGTREVWMEEPHSPLLLVYQTSQADAVDRPPRPPNRPHKRSRTRRPAARGAVVEGKRALRDPDREADTRPSLRGARATG